jgi:hypothetical protein
MKVVFDLAAQRISIEGNEPELVNLLKQARELAPALSHIEISTREKSGQAPSSEASGITTITPQNGGQLSTQTMRQFVRGLGLTNVSERIAAIAYFAKHAGSKEIFSPKEMDGWFTVCGLQKPGQMSVAIYDAKRKYGYVESSAHGKWKVSTDGENLVITKQNKAEDTAPG